MALTPLQERFVMHFGEMGSRWGVSRTVGQIYAVLFLSEEPLCADDLVEALGVSRSNVSMGLKELQSWKLLRLSRKQGDRRDYYTTPEDLWAIVRTLAEQRKAREIDPTLTVLRDLLMQENADPRDEHARERIRETAALIELLTGWFDEINRLDDKRIEQLLQLGASIQRVLDWKDRLKLLPGGKEA